MGYLSHLLPRRPVTALSVTGSRSVHLHFKSNTLDARLETTATQNKNTNKISQQLGHNFTVNIFRTCVRLIKVITATATATATGILYQLLPAVATDRCFALMTGDNEDTMAMINASNVSQFPETAEIQKKNVEFIYILEKINVHFYYENSTIILDRCGRTQFQGEIRCNKSIQVTGD